MSFELVEDAAQFAEGFRHRLFHRQRLGARRLARSFGQILWGADAGDDILALGIDQPFAIPGARAGRGVAGKGDASGRSVAHIAEHHRLDIDSGAPFAGDGIQAAIAFRAVAFPTREDRPDPAPELTLRLRRTQPPGFPRNTPLEL